MRSESLAGSTSPIGAPRPGTRRTVFLHARVSFAYNPGLVALMLHIVMSPLCAVKRSGFALLLFVVVAGTACDARGSGGSVTMCEDAREGAICATSGPCVLPNDFSSCQSSICECTGGRYHCEAIAPSDGEPCTAAPIQSCSYEGNPSCAIAPTSQGCGCGADGTWHCACACYGSQSTCAPGCPARFIPEMEGALCTAGLSCPYPGVTCRCVDDGSGAPRLHCT